MKGHRPEQMVEKSRQADAAYQQTVLSVETERIH